MSRPKRDQLTINEFFYTLFENKMAMVKLEPDITRHKGSQRFISRIVAKPLTHSQWEKWMQEFYVEGAGLTPEEAALSALDRLPAAIIARKPLPWEDEDA